MDPRQVLKSTKFILPDGLEDRDTHPLELWNKKGSSSPYHRHGQPSGSESTFSFNFNPLDYMDHQRKEVALIEAQLINLVSQGCVLHDKFDDHFILKLMFTKFGEMDVNNTKTVKLFETFKKQFEEQVQKWREKVGDMSIKDKKDNRDIQELRNTVKEGNNKYGCLDPWKNLKEEGEVDWILLPRPWRKWGYQWMDKVVDLLKQKMKTLQLQGIKVYVSPEDFTDQDIGPELAAIRFFQENEQERSQITKLVNLAIFDPKFWDFPTYTDNQVLPSSNRCSFPLVSCRRLNELIYTYPNGISLGSVPTLFMNKFGYQCGKYDLADARKMEDDDRPDWFSAVPKWDDVCDINDVFQVMKAQKDKRGKDLLFPAEFRDFGGKRSAYDKKLEHYIAMAIAMSEKRLLNVKELVESLKNIFGICLSLEQMGYESDVEFLQDYLPVVNVKKSSIFVDFIHLQKPDYKIRLDRGEPLESRSIKTYFIVKESGRKMFQDYTRTFEDPAYYLARHDKQEGRNDKRISREPYPRGFLRPEETIVEMADWVRPGEIENGVCIWVLNPSRFYGILSKDQDSLNNLESALRLGTFKKFKPTSGNISDFLCLGQYVVARCEHQGKQEWFRGQIVKYKKEKMEEGKIQKYSYLVRLIDYGEKVWVPQKKVNLLPKKLAIPKVGVPCYLYFNDSFMTKKTRSYVWTKTEQNIFTSMLTSKPVKIEFIKCSSVSLGNIGTIDDLDAPKLRLPGKRRYPSIAKLSGGLPDMKLWGIKISILDKNDPSKTLIPDLAEEYRNRLYELNHWMAKNKIIREFTFNREIKDYDMNEMMSKSTSASASPSVSILPSQYPSSGYSSDG